MSDIAIPGIPDSGLMDNYTAPAATTGGFFGGLSSFFGNTGLLDLGKAALAKSVDLGYEGEFFKYTPDAGEYGFGVNPNNPLGYTQSQAALESAYKSADDYARRNAAIAAALPNMSGLLWGGIAALGVLLVVRGMK